MPSEDRFGAMDRIAYYVWLAYRDEDVRRDIMEDLKRVAPEGWIPPLDGSEAQQRWEKSWDKEGDPVDRAEAEAKQSAVGGS